MPISSKLTTALVATIATGAMAAPAAVAMPSRDGVQSGQQAVHVDSAHQALLLRSRALQAQLAHQQTKTQDLRSADAIDAAVHPHRFVATTRGSAPVQSNPAGRPSTNDDGGTPWTTILIGVGGAALVAGGAAGIARTRPRRVPA